jgi:hypothetical protein
MASSAGLLMLVSIGNSEPLLQKPHVFAKEANLMRRHAGFQWKLGINSAGRTNRHQYRMSQGPNQLCDMNRKKREGEAPAEPCSICHFDSTMASTSLRFPPKNNCLATLAQGRSA